MSITILHDYFPEWDSVPLKFKAIIHDVASATLKYCQDYMLIERIDKEGSEYIFYCRRFPRGGLNNVLRIIEIMNEIYQFDPKREIIPFMEITDRGFLFRCCWETHSLNKKYKKEAMSNVTSF